MTEGRTKEVVLRVRADTGAAARQIGTVNTRLAALNDTFTATISAGAKAGEALRGLTVNEGLAKQFGALSRGLAKVASPDQVGRLQELAAALSGLAEQIDRIKAVAGELRPLMGELAKGAAAPKLQEGGAAVGILADLKVAAQATIPALTAASAGVAGLGKDLDRATDPINELRNGIEGVGDRLVILGRVGEQARNVIEEITDPVLRLKVATQLSERALRGKGLGFTYLSDRAKAYKAEAILLLGSEEALNKTVAQSKAIVLGLAGALVGTGVAALKSFLGANKETKKAGDDLKKAFDGLVYTVGNALVGGGQRGSAALGFLTDIVKRLAKAVDENRQTIADFAISAANAFLYVAEYGGKAILGLKTIFNLLQDLADNVAYSIGETFNQLVVTLVEAAKSIADILPESVNQALGDPSRFWGEALQEAQYELQAFYAGHGKDSPGFKRVQESADQIEAYSKTFDDLRAKLSSLQGQGFSGTGGRAPRAGGGTGGGGPMEVPSGALSGLFGEPLAQVRDLAVDLAASGDRAQATFGLLAPVLRDVVQPAVSEAFGSMTDFMERAQEQTKALLTLTDNLGQSMVSFGGFALQGFTAFALGATSAGGFFGSLISNLGQIASSTGSFLLLAGAGFQALPLGFTAAGAVGAGAGLLALGATLGVAGAALSSGGGASAASAGGGGARAFVAPSLGERPELAQNRRTEIVLQVGREVLGRVIEDEVNARISLNRILNVPATAR